MSKTNFACLAICLNLALTWIPFSSLPVPNCVSETLCQRWNYPHRLLSCNNLMILASMIMTQLAPWPHNFSTFSFPMIFVFTLYQKLTDVATPWIQSSYEFMPPAKFWLVSYSLPTAIYLPFYLIPIESAVCPQWLPVFVLIVYQLFPNFSYLSKLWKLLTILTVLALLPSIPLTLSHILKTKTTICEHPSLFSMLAGNYLPTSTPSPAHPTA